MNQKQAKAIRLLAREVTAGAPHHFDAVYKELKRRAESEKADQR